MTPELEAALGGRRVVAAGLLRIALPGHVATLCDGAATVSFNSELYSGKDALLGTIAEVSAIAEEVGDTFPTMTVTFLPPGDVATADLLDPAWQGSQVRLWLAAIDEETGEVIPDPELLFGGEIDMPTVEIDAESRRLKIEISSVFERLFEPDEGARLADSFHQWVWPGEKGFDQITGTPVERLWGPGEKNGGAYVV